MINSQDIKKGTAIRMDGSIWVCIDFQHRKPGKGIYVKEIRLNGKRLQGFKLKHQDIMAGGTLEFVMSERRP